MFRKISRRVPARQKPDDEREIESEAYLALRSSRTELRRAKSILEELRKVDAALENRDVA